MSSLHTHVKRILRETRALTLPSFGTIEHTEKTNAYDVVTRLDTEVETFLAQNLTQVDPGIGFVGEEFGGDRGKKTYWLADPIDGTMHFVRGIPFCTTMVALIDSGSVVMGFIYDFVSDTLFSAERGQGAYKNDTRIHVSERPFSEALCSIETQSTKPENNALYTALRTRIKTIKTVSSGHEFALVASGKIEGRISADPYGKDYDYAAGSLLVEEAGGVVQNIGLTTYTLANLNFIAGNSAFVQGLTESADALLPKGKTAW